jgi:hypothetical protein
MSYNIRTTLDVQDNLNIRLDANISGSLSVTGSINGNLNGTATSASYVLNAVSSSFAISSSFATTASFALSSSRSISSSFALSSSFAISSSRAISASYYQETDPIFVAKSASLATTGSNNFNGNQTITGSLIQGLEGNIATGENSHAEGSITKAIGNYSHAEGDFTQAKGDYSHAEGQETIASGSYSHAEGYQTIALANHQHVQGQWNATSLIPAAFIVGNGTDDSNRSNLIYAYDSTVEITGSLGVNGGITGSLQGTASWARNAQTASFALNGGVTQLLAGPNVTLSPTNGLGQVTVSATLSGSTSFNTATGSYGSFYDTTIQTNPVANIPRSMSFDSTDITNGVSISGSTSPFNTYIKTENAGIYNIQFSAQVEKTDSGTDVIVIWLRKNGIDLTDTATKLTLTGNGTKVVAAWNWFATSAANDYYQIIWSSADTGMRLYAEPADGTPGIPSVILTVNRVDQFLSNTGSFSGSFTGQFTGSLFGTSSWAQNALTSSFITSTGTNAFIQNGNSFGATALLGTNDNNNLAFETSGSVRMFISSSGRVGIGTITPGHGLDILTPSGDINYLRVAGNGVSNTNGNITLGNVTGTAGVFAPLLSSKSSNLSFPGMYFIGDGASGTDSGTTPMIRFDGRINNGAVSTRPLIGFSNVGVDVMTVLANGNVGIGALTPSTKLQVRGASSGSGTTAFRVENSNASASLTITDAGVVTTGGALIISNTATAAPVNGSATIQAAFGNHAGQFEIRPNNLSSLIYFSNGGSGGGMYLGTSRFFSTPFSVFASGSVIVGDYSSFANNTAAPARFAVSGSGAQTLVKVDSTTISNILNISSSGAVTISGSLNLNGQTVISTGSVTLTTGSITMPNRSAFRVFGASVTGIPASTTISGSATTVDYNQGNNYNNATGVYTAPVAGLYSVYYNGRTNSGATQQVIIYRNSITSSLMWETTGSNSGHFGVSSILNLAVNDTLRATVTVGTIQFDNNDNWGAAFIG